MYNIFYWKTDHIKFIEGEVGYWSIFSVEFLWALVVDYVFMDRVASMGYSEVNIA